MAVVLLVGSDAPLMEGISQSLVSAGHQVRIAHSVDEAIELAFASPPLIAVVERALAAHDQRTLRLPITRGGALLLFRRMHADASPLSAAFGRAALADLALPLERHRLVALVGWVADRAGVTGRGHRDTPPEQPAP
jgi:hypothetical protein